MSKKKNLDYSKVKDMMDKQISEGQKVAAEAMKYRQVQPTDPQMTIEVKNDELESMIADYSKEMTEDKLTKLIGVLRLSRVLSPANLNEEQKPVPCLINNPEHGTFFPIYTAKEHIPEEPKSEAILNIPYLAANEMAIREDSNVEGIVINPFSHNLVLKSPLLQKIAEVEKAIKENQPKMQRLRLTPEQYVTFERHQYEAIHIPRRLFKEGQAFIDLLCEKKAEFVDEFYEECFQQKRLYPFLPEDFSVLTMDVSEELLVVRIDFPAKDIVQGCSQRAYIAWKKAENKARYFLIEAVVKDAPMTLAEVTEEGKHLSRGEAPVEGAELQRIIDIVNGDNEEA